jgi:hypothetical protein
LDKDINLPNLVSECDAVEGLSVTSGVTENNAGVMFSDEAPICAVPAQVVDSGVYSVGDDMQDVKNYLGRPTLIGLGNLSSTVGSLFSTSAQWSQFATLIPFFADRLRGVEGLRATLVFTVQHSANPFHQGLLVSCFQYGTGVAYDRTNVPFACTNLPHVRLNVADNTMSVLRVPFMAEVEYWGRSTSEDQSTGVFRLQQVLPTPLLTSSAAPSFKVFLHMEDIQLIGRRPVTDTVVVTPQAGSLSRSEAVSSGAASGVLEASSKFARAVGNHLPGLRAFTGPAAWFLNASSKAAAAFGFSKPVDLSAVTRTLRVPTFFEHAVDVVAPAVTVGGFQSNQVSVDPKSGGSEVDEMAFDTILTRYCQIFRGTLPNTLSHGATVYASAVCPMHMWFRAQGATLPGGNISLPEFSSVANFYQPSSIMYFAQFFKYWTGSLRYRITFAKSKFHTGRVLFTFILSAVLNTNTSLHANAGTAPALFNGRLQPSQLSKVFDLKDGNVFEFDVDYIFPTPYAGVNNSIGTVSMQVMDTLVNNGESFDIISYIVEVCAKPGFHFAGLKSPAAPAYTQSTAVPILQSGVGVMKADVADLTVGEKFMSAKQLAMAATVRRFDAANAAITTTTIPYWCANTSWPTTAAAIDTAARDFPLTRSALVAACYSHCVGSTLFSIGTSLGNISAYKVYLEDADFNSRLTSRPASIYNSDSQVNSISVLGSLGLPGGTFLLPTLSPVMRYDHAAFTNLWAWGSNIISNSNFVSSVYKLAYRNSDGANRIAYVGIAAADDARGVGYIGPPLCLLRTTVTGGGSWTTANGM